ncbi:DNA (cytosine-5)-methyltransferase 3A-like, partial [Saccoglossus kowalevskii]
DNVIMTGGKYDHSIRRVVHGLREKPSKVEKFQSPETKKKKKGKGKHEEKQKHGLHRKECIAAVKIESNGQKNSVAATEESQNHSMNEMRFCIGTLVWGKIKGFPWWPAVVISHIEVEKPPPQLIDQRWVRWYGDLKHSLVSLDKLQPFHEFKPYYNDVIFKQQQSYRKGVYQALTMAAKRAERPVVTPDIAPTSDVTPLKTPRGMPIEMVTLCLDLVNWAMEGFLPNGPGAIVPSKGQYILGGGATSQNIAKICTTVPSEKMRKVVHGKKTLRDYCIACGDDDVITEHPLFEGEVCDECRQSILETAFLYDDDGYQSFCCICGEGRELVLCSNDGCFHCYCLDCLDCLVGRGATRKVRHNVDNGLLKCRKDWSQRLHQFFSSDDNNSEQFESFPVYCPLPIEERKPMRVLSLFDGIATGMIYDQQFMIYD